MVLTSHDYYMGHNSQPLCVHRVCTISKWGTCFNKCNSYRTRSFSSWDRDTVDMYLYLLILFLVFDKIDENLVDSQHEFKVWVASTLWCMYTYRYVCGTWEREREREGGRQREREKRGGEKERELILIYQIPILHFTLLLVLLVHNVCKYSRTGLSECHLFCKMKSLAIS